MYTYTLQASVKSDFSAIIADIKNIDSSTTSMGIGGLYPGINYFVRIKTESSSGSSIYLNAPWTITTQPNSGSPNPPTDIQFTNITCSSFLASWNSVPLATEYYVEVARDINFNSTAFSKTASENSCQVTNLQRGTLYYVRIRSMNQNGAGLPSPVRTVSTLSNCGDGGDGGSGGGTGGGGTGGGGTGGGGGGGTGGEGNLVPVTFEIIGPCAHRFDTPGYSRFAYEEYDPAQHPTLLSYLESLSYLGSSYGWDTSIPNEGACAGEGIHNNIVAYISSDAACNSDESHLPCLRYYTFGDTMWSTYAPPTCEGGVYDGVYYSCSCQACV